METIISPNQQAHETLQRLASELRNQPDSISWIVFEPLDEERRKVVKLTKYFFIFGTVFVLAALFVIFVLLKDDGIPFRWAIAAQAGLFFWAMIKYAPLINAQAMSGYRKVDYQLDFQRNTLQYATSGRTKSSDKMTEFPDMIPLPNQPTEQEREWQRYIYQEIQKRTGLKVVK